MIKERFMVTGRRLGDNSLIKGFYVEYVDPDEKELVKAIVNRFGACQEVDPDSVEPVAAPVKCERTLDSDIYKCPNCQGELLERVFGIIIELHKDNYCPNCGQRLDWSKGKDGTE